MAKKAKKKAKKSSVKKSKKKTVKKAAKKSVKKSSPKKKTVKRKKKPATIGDKISGAYHAVVDSITGTDALRNKMSKTGSSESE